MLEIFCSCCFSVINKLDRDARFSFKFCEDFLCLVKLVKQWKPYKGPLWNIMFRNYI